MILEMNINDGPKEAIEETLILFANNAGLNTNSEIEIIRAKSNKELIGIEIGINRLGVMHYKHINIIHDKDMVSTLSSILDDIVRKEEI